MILNIAGPYISQIFNLKYFLMTEFFYSSRLRLNFASRNDINFITRFIVKVQIYEILYNSKMHVMF